MYDPSSNDIDLFSIFTQKKNIKDLILKINSKS